MTHSSSSQALFDVFMHTGTVLTILMKMFLHLETGEAQSRPGEGPLWEVEMKMVMDDGVVMKARTMIK